MIKEKLKKLSLKKIIPYIVICASVIMLLLANISLARDIKVLSYNDFIYNLYNGNVKEVLILNDSYIQVKMVSGFTYRTDNPQTAGFKETLLLNGVVVKESRSFNPISDIPALLLLMSVVYLSLRYAKKVKQQSEKKGPDHLNLNNYEDINVNFNNVAGNHEAKESLKEVVEFLKNPERFSKYGARLPKGVMLFGDPGNGKTLMAKACAGEAGVPFYALSASDFIQVYVGVGASRIRKLFQKAKSHGKAVIFIDEIDAIGKKRSTGSSNDERDQTLNALLTEMSGFNEKDGIVVIAATNRLEILDDALLRPGRFDRHIEITMPDLNARKEILNLHLKNKPVGNIDLEKYAKMTAFFSGAKLESLANEAAILACKESAPFVEDIHLDKAFSIVMAGYEKSDYTCISSLDKKITSYHEIGHALLNIILLPNDKVSKVTIIPTSKGAGGYTMSIPEDKMFYTKDYMRKRIMVLLGGRSAEEIMFGKDNITTGAQNDIVQASNMMLKMITEYGMSDSLGLINYGTMQNYGISSPDVFNECKRVLDELYEEAKRILTENKDALVKLSEKLLDVETLYENDLIA